MSAWTRPLPEQLDLLVVAGQAAEPRGLARHEGQPPGRAGIGLGHCRRERVASSAADRLQGLVDGGDEVGEEAALDQVDFLELGEGGLADGDLLGELAPLAADQAGKAGADLAELDVGIEADRRQHDEQNAGP